MKQFFVLFFLCFCFFSLADHDDTIGFNYNGRRFPCQNFNRAKHFAEVHNKHPEHLYAFALCQLHRGLLNPGITTLKKAADKGSYMAAAFVYRYYLSDEYDLPRSMGRTTGNESNLLQAIDYMERVVKFIRDKPNYPFGDPKDLDVERETSFYLTTLNELTGGYINLFGIRISGHIDSVGRGNNGTLEDLIKNVGTLEALRKNIEVADICLSIPFNEQVWDKEIFDRRIAICRENKTVSEQILPREELRLRASLHEICRGKVLKRCDFQADIEQHIRRFFSDHTLRVAELILSLSPGFPPSE